HDIELCLLEWGSHLVLDHLDAGFVAHNLIALFYRADAANIQTHGRIELERIATGGGFGIAEHDTNLHPYLVDEDDHAIGTLDGRRKLTQGLAHEASLKARQRITHVAFDFGLGH